jgi:hypothetical protein
VLGGIGLSAWLAKTDYIVMSVLFLAVALVGLGVYRRHIATTCGETSAKGQRRK